MKTNYRTSKVYLFSFRKSIRKTNKNNWRWRRKTKAIQNQGQVETIKRYTYDDENSPLIPKQKEIFYKLVDERLDEITNLDKKVNHDDLIYKGKTPDENFNTYDNV